MRHLTFVCTDRGQHPVALLGEAHWNEGGLMSVTVPGYLRRKSLWREHAGATPDRLAALCPRCGRNPQMRNARARLEAIADAGMECVDISRLPL